MESHFDEIWWTIFNLSWQWLRLWVGKPSSSAEKSSTLSTQVSHLYTWSFTYALSTLKPSQALSVWCLCGPPEGDFSMLNNGEIWCLPVPFLSKQTLKCHGIKSWKLHGHRERDICYLSLCLQWPFTLSHIFYWTLREITLQLTRWIYS